MALAAADWRGSRGMLIPLPSPSTLPPTRAPAVQATALGHDGGRRSQFDERGHLLEVNPTLSYVHRAIEKNNTANAHAALSGRAPELAPSRRRVSNWIQRAVAIPAIGSYYVVGRSYRFICWRVRRATLQAVALP